jgi:hypothetical protein
MRNRALHDALRNFALEAAALLTDDLKAGAEVEFDVVDEGSGRGPALYRYEPRTAAFLTERWQRLRELPACAAACRELGTGASAWLRVNGMRGEQAEPALHAMLERLYEDSTSFGFPEERFDRVYQEVELTLYRDAVRARVVAPLRGAWMEADRLDLGDGLALVRGDALDVPDDVVFPEEGDGTPALLCVLERDVPAAEPIPASEAADRFAAVVTALRLWAPGGVTLGTPGWRQADHGRWQAISIGSGVPPSGPGWALPAGDEQAFREFFAVIDGARPSETVWWALRRFEMGCERRLEAEALSDHLLAVRALLDATSDAGEASLAMRLAALCAEEGARRDVQHRLEAALALERFVMGGATGVRLDAESPRELVAEVESHLRALLRDVLCGYLDSDLRGVADDILLEAGPEPFMEGDAGEIEARDLRREPRFEREPEPEPYLDFEREPEYEATPDYEPAHDHGPPPDYEPAPDYETARDYEPEVGSEPELASEPELDSEPDTAELEAVSVTPVQQPVQHHLDGVTESADWGWDDPEDFSAPV